MYVWLNQTVISKEFDVIVRFKDVPNNIFCLLLFR